MLLGGVGGGGGEGGAGERGGDGPGLPARMRARRMRSRYHYCVCRVFARKAVRYLAREAMLSMWMMSVVQMMMIGCQRQRR